MAYALAQPIFRESSGAGLESLARFQATGPSVGVMAGQTVVLEGGDRSRADFRPPRPLRALLIALLPVSAPAFVWAVGVASWRASAAFGGTMFALAVLRGGMAWRDLWRSRRLADRLLFAFPRFPLVSPLALWRAAELTSERNRRFLAKSVHGLAREAAGSVLPTAVPLNRRAARENLFLLRRLETRLADLTRPVSAHGVLVVDRLLTDGISSPLYCRERAAELSEALTEALAALEVC